MNEKYMVIGKDFQMYGPLDKRELHEMVRQGRADSFTKVKIVGTSAWRRLAELEGFFEENKSKKTNSEPNENKTIPSNSHHSKKFPFENALRAKLSKEELDALRAEFSKEDLGPDLTAKQARLFVGKNADLFIQQWSLMHLVNKKICLSWRIFLCSLAGPCWLSYRKMYKATLLFFVPFTFFELLLQPLDIPYTLLGLDIKIAVQKFKPLTPALERNGNSHDRSKAYWQKMQELENTKQEVMLGAIQPAKFSRFSALCLLNLLVGLFGCFYYKCFAARKITKIIDSYPVDQIEGEISNQGGTNVYACLLTILCVLLMFY